MTAELLLALAITDKTPNQNQKTQIKRRKNREF
jgi:hypothetical protein